MIRRMLYKGWQISWDSRRPLTGQFEAESKGVRMSAASEQAIRRLVDVRVKEYPPDGHGDPFWKGAWNRGRK